MTSMLLAWAVLGAGSAPDEWRPPRAMTLEEEPPAVRFRLDALAWRATASGWISITRASNPGSGSHMAIGSDVDLRPKFVPVVEGTAEIGDHHGFGLRYARIYEAGERTSEGSFIYRGTTFDAGRQTRAEIHFVTLEGDYQYTFNPDSPFMITAHLGFHYWRYFGAVKTTDSLTLQSERREFDSAFWLGGLEARWQVIPALELRALGAGCVQRRSQNFFKVEGDVLFRPTDRVALSAGYRLHAIRFFQSTNRSNYKMEGPTVGLELAF